MNDDLTSWRQAGRIFVWRYRNPPRMYRGWHITGDQAGCESVAHLLTALSVAAEPTLRTLSLTDPRTVGAERIFVGASVPPTEAAVKLRLENHLASPDAEDVVFSGGVLAFRLGELGLKRLSKAFNDVAAGQWDFGEKFGDAGVMFWEARP